MLYENIKHFRKAAGLSQSELAVQLHVVRQTVSKWEQGLSVPDADVLIHMAEILGVSVGELLDAQEPVRENLAEELERVNTLLAELTRHRRMQEQAAQQRGKILLLSFAAMLAMLLIDRGVVSVLLTGVCMLSAMTVLYRNLDLLTHVTTPDADTGILRSVTKFNIVFFACVFVLAVLIGTDVIVLSEEREELFAAAIIASVMIFVGIVSTKLPYNRHTGLRLPWTVTDEETWYAAHRVLGMISLPIALLYAACVWTIPDFGAVTLGAMAVWIGIPGGISYLHYRKKFFGK